MFRIDAPPETVLCHGDRSLDVDFDVVTVGGEMFLATHLLEMARTGQKGFRLVGFEPFPDE